MQAKTYTTRPVAVQAVQVTDIDTANDIVDWVKSLGGEAWSNERFRPGGVKKSGSVQYRGKDGQRYNVEEGEWLVLWGPKDFRRYTDEFFTANFDSVEAVGRHVADDE
jgi:hypothetical protein